MTIGAVALARAAIAAGLVQRPPMPKPDITRVDEATAHLALADARRDLEGYRYGQGTLIQRAWMYYCMRRVNAAPRVPLGCHMRDFAAWVKQQEDSA